MAGSVAHVQDPLSPLPIVMEFVAGQRGPLHLDVTFPRLPRSSVWPWASVLANGMQAECQVPASWNLTPETAVVSPLSPPTAA